MPRHQGESHCASAAHASSARRIPAPTHASSVAICAPSSLTTAPPPPPGATRAAGPAAAAVPQRPTGQQLQGNGSEEDKAELAKLRLDRGSGGGSGTTGALGAAAAPAKGGGGGAGGQGGPGVEDELEALMQDEDSSLSGCAWCGGPVSCVALMRAPVRVVAACRLCLPTTGFGCFAKRRPTRIARHPPRCLRARANLSMIAARPRAHPGAVDGTVCAWATARDTTPLAGGTRISRSTQPVCVPTRSASPSATAASRGVGPPLPASQLRDLIVIREEPPPSSPLSLSLELTPARSRRLQANRASTSTAATRRCAARSSRP